MKNKHDNKLKKLRNMVPGGLFFCLTFLMLSYSSFAQQANSASAGVSNDPRAAVNTGTSTTLLMKLHDMYPKDEYLMRAVHMQKVLDNPAAYPQMTAQDIENFKAKMVIVNAELSQVNSNLNNGDSYDVAISKMKQSQKSDTNQPSSKE